MLKTSMATLAAGLGANGGSLALIALSVVVLALAVGAAPDWGHSLLRLMRDWRTYRRESQVLQRRAGRARGSGHGKP